MVKGEVKNMFASFTFAEHLSVKKVQKCHNKCSDHFIDLQVVEMVRTVDCNWVEVGKMDFFVD